MANSRFGTVGQEQDVLALIRRMDGEGKVTSQILQAVSDAGYTARSGKPFTRQGIERLVTDLDPVRRVRLDLRQRASRLAESLAQVEKLSATDKSCALISAQVQNLQRAGVPQVQAVAEAVAV